MQTHIDPNLIADPELAAAVQRATSILESVIGESIELPQVEWSLERDDHGCPLIRLLLSDSYGQVVGHFRPDELTTPLPLKLRLLDLWGNLLKIRSHKQLNRLRSSIDELERSRVAQD